MCNTQSRITTAITQVAANKLKIKTDAKCDLGSSHCYHAVSPWQSVILWTLIVLYEPAACHGYSFRFSPNGWILSLLRPWIACRASLRLCQSLASMSRTWCCTDRASNHPERAWKVITSVITGHERKTNHFTPARTSAPSASHCYHAWFGF